MNSDCKTEQFGVHLMVDGYSAPREVLKDKALLERMLKEIPLQMGMHAITDPVVVEVGPKNRKDPGGLSGFILIAESHISFHTFPNRGFVTIDVYTCQCGLDTNKLITLFADAFQFSRHDYYIQERGIQYPSENIHQD